MSEFPVTVENYLQVHRSPKPIRPSCVNRLVVERETWPYVCLYRLVNNCSFQENILQKRLRTQEFDSLVNSN